jgi:hypothetical protein
VGVKGLEMKVPLEVESLGRNDHKVKDGQGVVFCHATEMFKSLVVAALLDGAVCR